MSESCGLSRRTTRVLIVEDDALVASVLGMVLTKYRSAEFVVESVSTLKEALARVLDPDRKRPGLLIIDLDLPDSVGTNSVEELCKAVPNVPAVVLTGYGSVMSADCMRAGAVEYLSKGDWTVESVVEKIMLALANHEVRGRFTKADHQLDEIDGTINKIARVEAQIKAKQ